MNPMEEKTESARIPSGEHKESSQPTAVTRKHFANGWEMTVTNGFRRALSREIAIRESIRRNSRRKLVSSAPKGTTQSTRLDQNLLTSFAQFMADGFGFTKDTEAKHWEMCTPLVQSLLETHALLEQEGIIPTDTAKRPDGEGS